MAADEGGGKPRGDAEQGSDADDLDALAGGLGSLAPSEGEATAEGDADEVHDLAALAALAARTSLATPESDGEAAPLRLSSSSDSAAVEAPASTTQNSAPAAASADRPVRASAATPASDFANTDFAAAAAASVVLTPRARAAWMTPLLVGIGVGIGIAGVTYVLSQREAPTASANAATSVPAEPPVAAPPAQPEPAVAAVVPAVVPSGPARGEQPVAAAPEPSAVQHPGAMPRPRADARSAAAERLSTGGADKPVISVQPASDPAAAEAAEPDLAATVAADKPASTMDALLDEALSPKARRDELAARQQAALEANAIPATPSREEVTQAMTVLLPAIRGCAMGQSGLATAGIVVHSDGRVASVEVAGAPFAGSASGRCMEGVLRRARFPRFTQPSFRIKFPLAIQ